MNLKTVNTRITCGMLLCCKEKANQIQDEKTGLQFFLVRFDLPTDWSSHNSRKKCQVKSKCSQFLDSHSNDVDPCEIFLPYHLHLGSL